MLAGEICLKHRVSITRFGRSTSSTYITLWRGSCLEQLRQSITCTDLPPVTMPTYPCFQVYFQVPHQSTASVHFPVIGESRLSQPPRDVTPVDCRRDRFMAFRGGCVERSGTSSWTQLGASLKLTPRSSQHSPTRDALIDRDNLPSNPKSSPNC